MSETNGIKINFGLVLKELREKHNLTQEQLAEKFNLQSYQTINKIENGKSFVSSELLEVMCNFFQVSPSFFFVKRSQLSEKEHINYISQIKRLLPSLSKERLKDIYNIMLTFLE